MVWLGLMDQTLFWVQLLTIAFILVRMSFSSFDPSSPTENSALPWPRTKRACSVRAILWNFSSGFAPLSTAPEAEGVIAGEDEEDDEDEEANGTE